MIREVDMIQQAYEDAVFAVMDATNCEEQEAAAAVEKIVELMFRVTQLTHGDFNATSKH
jgi:hypothetical protein